MTRVVCRPLTILGSSTLRLSPIVVTDLQISVTPLFSHQKGVLPALSRDARIAPFTSTPPCQSRTLSSRSRAVTRPVPSSTKLANSSRRTKATTPSPLGKLFANGILYSTGAFARWRAISSRAPSSNTSTVAPGSSDSSVAARCSDFRFDSPLNSPTSVRVAMSTWKCSGQAYPARLAHAARATWKRSRTRSLNSPVASSGSERSINRGKLATSFSIAVVPAPCIFV